MRVASSASDGVGRALRESGSIRLRLARRSWASRMGLDANGVRRRGDWAHFGLRLNGRSIIPRFLMREAIARV